MANAPSEVIRSAEEQEYGHEELGFSSGNDVAPPANKDDHLSDEWQPEIPETSASSSEDEGALDRQGDINSDVEGLQDGTVADEVVRTSKYVLQMLFLERFGCGPEGHTRHLAQHFEECDDENHHTLSATHEMSDRKGLVKSKTFPADTIGLAGRRFPTPQDELRRRFARAENIREVMNGTPVNAEGIKHICLHNEHRPHVSPTREFDVDSVLVFPHSLGAIRRTVQIQFTKQTSFNIQTHLHIMKRVNITRSNGQKQSQLRPLNQIPHLYLGTVDQVRHGALYAFFPNIRRKTTNKNTFLTNDQARRFFDQGLLPACKEFVSDGTWSHMVPSYQAAADKSRAKGYEQQTAARRRGLEQHRGYVCRPEVLSDIWDELLRNIADPRNDLEDFEDVFLFVNAKNLKSGYKNRSALESLSSFWSDTTDNFDMDLADALFDIGTEITPPQVRTSDRAQGVGSPITYLWKGCCLEHEKQRILAGPLGSAPSGFQTYHNGFLRDATCMTLEVPKRSWIRRGGWVYAQWYNVVKEVQDAQKIFPFQHEDLVDLAIDPSIYKESTRGKPWQDVVNSYLNSKSRTQNGFQDCRLTSYGSRFEVRVTLACFRQILDDLVCMDCPIENLTTNPEYVWAIHTNVWADFMVGNYEKLTSLLEVAILTSPRTGMELSVSRLVYVILLCIRHFANSDVRRTRVLRYRELSQGERVYHGLDMETNIQHHGFGWFADIVDWERFSFRQEVANLVIGADRALGRFYRSSARLVQNTKDVVDFCFQYLGSCEPRSQNERSTLLAISHFVLRQYRRDVLDRLAALGEVREKWKADEMKDGVQFCLDGLTEALLDRPQLMAGGRMGCKTPEALFEWLMGYGGTHNRGIMDGAATGGTMSPFRKMLRQVYMLTDTDAGLRARWTNVLQQEFKLYMWLIPYPNAYNGSLIQTRPKKGSRGFWSAAIDHTGKWLWAERQARPGFPMPWPKTLNMTVVELQEHLDRSR